MWGIGYLIFLACADSGSSANDTLSCVWSREVCKSGIEYSVQGDRDRSAIVVVGRNLRTCNFND